MIAALAGCGAAAGAAAGICLSRRRRRRRAMREALHEVRRPLQALMLGSSPGTAGFELLIQLRVALADLEAAAEGRRAGRARGGRVTAAELLQEAERRWPGAPVSFLPPGDADTALDGDRVRLGMALDNLIANGLEHGAGEVSVAARGDRGRLRLEVFNGEANGSTRSDPEERARGNGLRIAARHVAADGGRIDGPRDAGGRVVAAVELPRSGSASDGA